MVAAFLYSPYIRYTEDQILRQQVEGLNKALNDRNEGIPTPSPSDADYPAAIYSAARAGNRQVAFMGGGALLLAGAVFAAVGARPRTQRDGEEGRVA